MRLATLTVALLVAAPAAAQEEGRVVASGAPDYGGGFEAAMTAPEVPFDYRGRWPLVSVDPSFAERWSPGLELPRVPQGAYRELCPGPCRASLAAGVHVFGLQLPDGEVWVSLPPLQLREGAPTRIEAHLHDHGADRAGGIALGTLLPVAGGVIATVGAWFAVYDTPGFEAPGDYAGVTMIVLGSLLGLVGIVAGIALGVSRDRAWVEGFPLESTPPAPSEAEAPEPAAERAAPVVPTTARGLL